MEYIPLNVAQPPFDDEHVRRAVAMSIDRDRLARLAGGPQTGTAVGHLLPDSLLGNALVGVQTLPTGDPEVAADEMRRSRYDGDGDGVCDARACRRVRGLAAGQPPYPAMAGHVVDALASLGIRVRFQQVPPAILNRILRDPGEHVGLAVGVSWRKLYPDAVTFALPLFGRNAIGPEGCCNYSLLGARRAELRRFDYGSGPVPDAGPAIRRCEGLLGGDRIDCWAALDRELTAGIVPAVPILARRNVDVVSARVTAYSFDQFAAMAALDRIAVVPD